MSNFYKCFDRRLISLILCVFMWRTLYSQRSNHGDSVFFLGGKCTREQRKHATVIIFL